ncbi:MAG: TetR/AcrR family transcriptional regulator [Rhodospirillales bacterium]
MPWVKDFDVDTALDQAMGVFWAKGYEAASLSDLIAAMKINKGSLYNAFGSKKALFVRAVLKYDRDGRQASLAKLALLDDPQAAIAALFDGMIAESGDDVARKGCLLVNTALEMPNHEPDIRELIAASLADFEAFLERTIRQGQDRGQFRVALDPRVSAKSLLAQVVGFRVLARGVYGPDDLQAIRDAALKQLAA